MLVNSPLFFTRCIKNDSENLKHRKTKLSKIGVQSFCGTGRENGDFNTDQFQLINEPPPFYNEFHALNQYLATIEEEDIEILRFQSSFTALGQLYFHQYPVDGFLTFKKKNNQKTFIKIIQYQSVFRHGHISSCFIKNDENEQKLADTTIEVKMKISSLLQHFVEHFQLNHIE